MINKETFRDHLGREIAYIHRNCPAYVENLKLIRSAEMEKLLRANDAQDIKFTQGVVHTLDILIGLMYIPDEPEA